ncbi:glycoside hydrolase family 32 protein [Leeuwenhoekiella aequorea]|uniref:Levanase/fructan beta-fructosidase n=1 Tax=Leeuwenhoekiella aequorea TaxID=283736 RepID=A0A4Q0P692_9FLAO|nr:glycoside hydrolase family 32 protein [Leeuwenhoekiella aequorea]RXG21915.1 levanase/fructan beta-fructosidase [Leeuwenhoekiella aequorea]
MNYSTTLKILPVLGLLLFSCQNKVKKDDNQDAVKTVLNEEELYRPNYHFTPENNWMNDPNGMFYLNGYYHLYFQHYPDGNTWGPMHWGHATSLDLVNWKEQPIALYPDSLGYIFSGSAVVDYNNDSGFAKEGKPVVVAMYTYHDPVGEKENTNTYQTQGIAYSQDEGLTWTKYEGNPVIKNTGIKDFRDPKITWDSFRDKWVMVLAAGQETQFFESSNLKEWTFLSSFGEGIGNHNGVWECPELIPFQVEDSEEVKWVLLVSINPGGPNGGSATQYFVGDFDGKKFSVDPAFKLAMQEDHNFWVDLGKDNYAGVTFSNTPASDGRKIFMGWMSNWQYANKVPTEKWRSTMTIPRELTLEKVANTYRLYSNPVKEFEAHYGETDLSWEKRTFKNGESLLDENKIDLSKARISFNLPDANKNFTFVLKNKVGDSLKFGYEAAKRSFFIDRKKSGIVDFNKSFADIKSVAPRISTSGEIQVELLLDKTSIELFYDKGETVMTEIFFPKEPYKDLIITGLDEGLLIENLTIDQLEFKQ